MSGRGRPIGSYDKTLNVRHTERECARHGLTTHAWTVGNKADGRWNCMQCSREVQRRCRERQAAGLAGTHNAPTPEPTRRPCCPDCFTELPATGICGVCE